LSFHSTHEEGANIEAQLGLLNVLAAKVADEVLQTQGYAISADAGKSDWTMTILCLIDATMGAWPPSRPFSTPRDRWRRPLAQVGRTVRKVRGS
jgi:hypothetical protein